MTKRIPTWFQSAIREATEHWEHKGKLYAIREVRESSQGVKWCLDYADLDGLGGGGSPFRTREELDDFIQRRELRAGQQLTLDL